MSRAGLLVVAVAVPLVSSLFGCDPRPIQDSIDGGTPGAGGKGGAGMGGAGGMPASGTLSYSAAEVQAVLAQCDLPHGPAVSPVTYGDKRALLVGPWIQCPAPVDTVFAPAIVFAADGTWEHLLYDANGGLVSSQGVKNQGTYEFPLPDTQPTNGNPYLTVHAASGAWTPTDYSSASTAFETSPLRMFVSFSYNAEDFELWLVRFPQ